ncbi:MAG: RNA polymerase sigma factor, partial [Clostridia bacterium]|nr:RNA polymerase sigma factor [Clostridia bacterium]
MYYQMEADETLVMLTLAGDEGAYEALVKRYQRAVISSAISITKNHFMAEDAAQDAFVTAWMKLDTLYEAQKFGAWVCKIAKNCALNMITRYRSFLPLDVVENADVSYEHWLDPAEEYALSEERKEVDQSVERLPDRVRETVRLHYFEGLSIAEIADKMRLSAGTVKWQLNDGRRRIRKELCAMNERYGDTLTERVMKKVEEIKLWQLKNDKSGFEALYKELLREVEELPESSVRSHALADVLMRGWWWIPGKKNDALFARIADAATKGKNEDVMTFIVAREDSVLHGDARIEFIRDKQIPRLEKLGFVKTLGREWFWLGYNCFREGRMDEAHAAYLQVEKVLSEGDAYFALVPYTKMMEEQLSARYKDTVKERYRIGAIAEELRMVSGALRYWNENGFGEGYLGSMDRQSGRIFRNASCCDGQFFAEIAPGEVYEGTDGTRLLYISDNESADTPLGRFEGCKVWETRCWTDIQKIACRTYYKEGIGIVRQEHTADGVTEVRTLSAYEIKGGSGLLPLYTGNTWEYSSGESPEAPSLENTITVSFADADRVLLTHWENVERRDYDESSWVDMVQEIANEYMITDNNGNARVCDVSHAIERACLLAVTPMQKAHSEAAASVARRIMETDPVFNPDYKTTGHWNFFGRNYIRRKGETLCLTGYNSGWSFEYKCYGGEVAEEPILYNDILGILQDAANCLWSEEWRIGESSTVEYTFVSNDIKTLITCMDGGTVTTQAGCFRNCLKLCLDIKGMESGWSYRGGKKAYYFAEGIGLVRTENTYCGGAMTAVYQLTSYEGTGDGYMPICDGFKRRY